MYQGSEKAEAPRALEVLGSFLVLAGLEHESAGATDLRVEEHRTIVTVTKPFGLDEADLGVGIAASIRAEDVILGAGHSTVLGAVDVIFRFANIASGDGFSFLGVENPDLSFFHGM